MMSLIHLLQRHGFQITFASAARLSPHREDLEALGIAEVAVAVNDSGFDSLVRELDPELVLFDRFMTEEQFGWRVAGQCPDAMRVLDTEDLHSLRHARQEACKESRPLDRADLRGDLALREMAAILRSDLSLIISRYEMELLQEEFGVADSLLHYCPFMLTPVSPKRRQALPSFEQRQHFVSIGNFRHPPNLDAVRWLKAEIWPGIRRQLPQAELHLYGAYPPPQTDALEDRDAGLFMKGWADDAAAAQAAARVCLAPLRFGAGLKGKLAEAMQCGTPSVTTAVGAEAMSGGLPWPGRVEDDAESIALAAVQLYQSRLEWEQAQRQGFDIVQREFDGEQLGVDLMQRLEATRQQLSALRQANFTGAMLRHHQHRSTEFMSRWIEAKNQLEAEQARKTRAD